MVFRTNQHYPNQLKLIEVKLMFIIAAITGHCMIKDSESVKHTLCRCALGAAFMTVMVLYFFTIQFHLDVRIPSQYF